MGRYDRLSLSALSLLALAGCGHHRAGEPQEERVFTPPPHAVNVQAERAAEVRILDEHGACLPSGLTVAGLPLPRGIEPADQTERRHVYTSHLSTTALTHWFGPLLVTGAVNRMGEGVVYRDATVRGAAHGSTHLDVSILPVGVSEVRIEISERLPPPEHPMSEAEARRLLARPVD